ncbi:MAG: hypothetical protein QGF68_04580 [Nitrospinota bacterium]|jgi:hypothetical protein|nr:hypothetical protein [Nitrospinota bacterium]HJM43219.1 hypothetical protein [Nitrospinota bacterium]
MVSATCIRRTFIRPDSEGEGADRGGPGRRRRGSDEKATALLDEALAIPRELGMRPLMERVLAHKDILKA